MTFNEELYTELALRSSDTELALRSHKEHLSFHYEDGEILLIDKEAEELWKTYKEKNGVVIYITEHTSEQTDVEFPIKDEVIEIVAKKVMEDEQIDEKVQILFSTFEDSIKDKVTLTSRKKGSIKLVWERDMRFEDYIGQILRHILEREYQRLRAIVGEIMFDHLLNEIEEIIDKEQKKLEKYLEKVEGNFNYLDDLDLSDLVFI
jgi:ribosomal protein L18E